MIGTAVNMLLILIGSAIGLLFRKKIKQSILDGLMTALGLAVLVIGVSGAIRTEDMLCLIICLALGTVFGECLKIETQLDRAGNAFQSKLKRLIGNESNFTEGFVSATLLFCVGSMAVMGSLEAGVNNDYSILISKGMIDGATSVAFSAAMGIGVAFSAISVGIYQGSLTLLASWAAPHLTPESIREMSAVGSVIIIGIGFNMMGIGKKLRVGNMLPAVFLPLLYVPLVQWITNM